MAYPLNRQPVAKRPRQLLAAFDIETDGFGGKVLGVGYRVEGDTKATLTRDPDEWVDAILKDKRRIIWYAHNAGGFDLLHLLPYLRAREGVSISVIWQGRKGRCIGMVVKQGRRRCELRDSYAICPTTLAKMADAFAPELPKGELDFDKVTWQWSNTEHRAYLARDVDALLTSVLRIWELSWATFTCWPRWTLGSTAMRAWRQMLPETACIWQLNRPVEDWVRQGYYGGFVFLRHYGFKEDVTALDVNAMYPSVMREFEFPSGTPCRTTFYSDTRLGMYRVTCYVPQAVKLPCLPLRHKEGVSWPTGKFETVVTTPEIEYARSLGCAVEVIDGYVWPDRMRPFVEIVDKCESLRKGSPPKSALSEFTKYLQNSLYGKFGTRREAEDVLLTIDDADAIERGYSPAFRSDDNSLIDGVWVKGKEIDAPYIQPHWAAYVTAYARLKLHRVIANVGVDRCWYGDTDSVWCDSEAADQAANSGLIELSQWHYGALKRDGPYARVEWRAAKVYCVWDDPPEEADKFPEVSITAKGIPKRGRTPWYWKRPKEYVKWEGMAGMRSLLEARPSAGPPSLAVDRRRRYSDVAASKSWVLGLDGHTVSPVDCAEPDELLEAEGRAELRAARAELAQLRGQVLAFGGIAPSREYPRGSIPRGLLRVHGLAPDVMAGEVGYSTADELLGALVPRCGA